MRIFIIALTLNLLAFPALAHHNPQHADDVTVKVDGLVCDFCAQSINKVFLKQPAVEKVNVNLDTKEVTLDFKPGTTLSNDDINKMIYYAGYSVVQIIR